MESDMFRLGVPVRPTTSEERSDKWIKYSSGLWVKNAADVLVRWMVEQLEEAKMGCDDVEDIRRKPPQRYEDVPDKWDRKWWPLNPRQWYDWRDIPISADELFKIAQWTSIEIDITEMHRKELLDLSDAAAFLRYEFKKMMDPFCMLRKVEYVSGGDPDIIVGWRYPDPYEMPVVLGLGDEIDMDAVLLTRQMAGAENECEDAMKRFLQTYESLPHSASSEKTDLLVNETRKTLDLIRIVCEWSISLW
jgi:hypothetical protein